MTVLHIIWHIILYNKNTNNNNNNTLILKCRTSWAHGVIETATKKLKGHQLGPPGVIHSSPSSEELTPILKIYQSGGENQGKQCVDQQDRKKKQHDFIWFPNIYGHKNIPFLHQTWLRRRLNHWPEPNLQACHGFSTNLSWCFGHWSTSSVPSRVIPITDPTCAYGRSYIGFAKKS